MTLKVYGSSDDLIEIEGDITEEFNIYFSDEYNTDDENSSVLLALSNGLVLNIEYNNIGLWKISQVWGDSSKTKYVFVATDPNSNNYSDVVLIVDSIEWVTLAKTDVFRRRKKT